MQRPRWIEPRLWPRVAAALAAQPEHAADALADLKALTASWDARRRARLVDAMAGHALGGAPLPAALMLGLAEVLDD